MGVLQVALFGNVRVTHNNWLSEVIMTREIQALLAYFLLHRHRVHSREAIAGVFWGERSQDKARRSLNTALWKLKKALEPEEVPAGTYLVNSHQGGVSFNRASQYWLDVEVFEAKINQVLAYPFQTVQESHLADLEKTLSLYKGGLLEGFYMDWMLRERERMRALYLKSLIYLLQYCRFHRVYEKAIAYGQQILDLEPLHEEIHREIMSLYLENGQRALALRQYEICHAILDRELGISPMYDTQALYLQICNTQSRAGPPHISQDKISFDQLVGQLKDARLTIDLAKEKIDQAFHLIAKYSQQQD